MLTTCCCEPLWTISIINYCCYFFNFYVGDDDIQLSMLSDLSSISGRARFFFCKKQFHTFEKVYCARPNYQSAFVFSFSLTATQTNHFIDFLRYSQASSLPHIHLFVYVLYSSSFSNLVIYANFDAVLFLIKWRFYECRQL